MTIKNKVNQLLAAFSLGLLAISGANASEQNIPQPFRGETKNSKFEINYDDYNAVLKSSVLLIGKSQRTKAKASNGSIGTRMKTRINKLTALEGNRVYFEGLNEEEYKNLLLDMRKSLESVPSEAPLNLFTADEQLAYWLNLYNISLLNEVLKIYPSRKLDDLIEDDDSVLHDKILNISNVPLSLKDIENILYEKYDADPLVIYGMFQGIIGGPNIRKSPYSGASVWAQLESNANEFINSNRGTYADKKNVVRVSSLYERNARYFPEFELDVKSHLLKYLEGSTRFALEDAKRVKYNINDWKIVDILGNQRAYGGSVNTNSAAFIDSVSAPTIPGLSGVGAANLGLAASFLGDRSMSFGRFTADQAELLKQLDANREIQSGNVTVKDDEPSQEK